MNLFEMASSQFVRAAELMKLDRMARTILSEPQNEIIVNFPVQMDDGHYRLFKELLDDPDLQGDDP